MIKAVICDDEKAAIDLMCGIIEEGELPVEVAGTAKNGRDAWNMIKSVKPDLVFLDVHMPYMDGFEIVSRLTDSKAIMVTACDSFEYAQRALRLGASDILLKPIYKEQLEQSIERAVGWRFTRNKVVDTILAYIYGHYNEPIELDKIAEITSCTPSHIARLFKKYTGMTIISYMHKVRIEKSAEMMSEKKQSIKEVAEAVGYQNLNHFYKYFNAQMGVTPAAYNSLINKG